MGGGGYGGGCGGDGGGAGGSQGHEGSRDNPEGRGRSTQGTIQALIRTATPQPGQPHCFGLYVDHRAGQAEEQICRCQYPRNHGDAYTALNWGRLGHA